MRQGSYFPPFLEIDDQSLQDLLVDLIHWADADDFDSAIEGALERYEEEVEEDSEAADDAAAAEAAAATTLAAEDRRVQQAQNAQLHAHRPQRYDA